MFENILKEDLQLQAELKSLMSAELVQQISELPASEIDHGKPPSVRPATGVQQISELPTSEIQELVAKIKSQVDAWAESSAQITSFQDRQHLAQIIEWWKVKVLELTGEVVSGFLLPSVIGVTWIGMDRQKLLNACRAKAQAYLETKKRQAVYNESWSVARNDIEREFDKFLQSDHPAPAMAVIGEAGVGKTFMICQLAQQSLRDEALFVLPYDSEELAENIRLLQSSPGNRLSFAFAQIIANDLGYPTGEAMERELVFIANLLRDSQLLICVDAVERFRHEDQSMIHLLTGIRDLLERFSSAKDKEGRLRVRLLLTALSFSWVMGDAEKRLPTSLFYVMEGQGKLAPPRIGWPMMEFTDDEFKQAYKAYTGKQAEGDAFDKAEDICQGSPYLLSLAAELMKQDKTELDRNAVLDAFYQSRIVGGSRLSEIQIDEFLSDLIRKHPEGADGVPPEALSNLGDPALDMLSLDGILVPERVKRGPFSRWVLNLRPKGMWEYLRERFENTTPATTPT